MRNVIEYVLRDDKIKEGYALIIGMTLAMRYAELHALKWSDLDFDDKSLLVKGQQQPQIYIMNAKIFLWCSLFSGTQVLR